MLISENPNRSLTIKISDLKIAAQIPSSLPNNLKIIINEKESAKSFTNSRPKFSSLLHTILSFIVFLGGIIALSLTIIIYFTHFLMSNMLSKVSLILLSPLLTVISVIPVVFILFSIHCYISEYLNAFFGINIHS